MKWERRTFLKALLAGMGSCGTLSVAIDRYAKAIAAPTPRKLALLVGIDDYSRLAVVPPCLPLFGCVTDVELQRELLIHRFGFSPDDIVSLTGEAATREAIETAFREHLGGQVKAGDAAIFHFSGYGTQVNVPTASDTSGTELSNGFLPSDGILPEQKTAVRNDFLETTLLLLARSLPTDKLTLVLDTSHQPAGQLRGNLRVRSFPTPAASLNPETFARQVQLAEELKTASKGFATGSATILRGAHRNGLAVEINQGDCHAGLFTYLLTQYLWQTTPPSKIVVALSRVAEQIAPLMGEAQQIDKQANNDGKHSLLAYSLLPEVSVGAEGLIANLQGQEAEIHLGGLPLPLLPAYGLNSCFQVVCRGDTPVLALDNGEKSKSQLDAPNSSGDARTVPLVAEPPLLQIYFRQGIVAKAKLIAASENLPPLQVGQLVQEAIRLLPRHLGLVVALDSQLERIERVDATSALAGISTIAVTTAAGGQAADCLLGKLPQAEGYGLFSPGGLLLSKTAGVAGEAIKSAVERLTPHLEQLLALKYWQLTTNEGSSRLGVAAVLELAGAKPEPLLWRAARREIGEQTTGNRQQERGKSQTGKSQLLWGVPDSSPFPALCSLPSGSLLQYRFDNRSDRPVYCLLVGVDASGKAVLLYISQPLLPGTSRTLPGTGNPPNRQSGLAQMQVIFATAPFSRVEEALKQDSQFALERHQQQILLQPLNCATALLQDLHAASAVPSNLLGDTTEVFALDIRQWASFCFVYQVTELPLPPSS